MFPLLRSFGLFAIVTVSVILFATGMKIAISPTKAQTASPHTKPVPRTIHERFATFLAGGDFKTVFVLQNFRQDVPVTVTPVLFLSEGEVPMEPVTVPAHSTATVDITAFLLAHGYQDTRGTAVMRYQFNPYDPITGVAQSSDYAHKLYLNSYAQSPEEYWQGLSYDAALWAPDEGTQGFISLTNTTAEPRVAHPTFLVNGHAEEQPAIRIPPRSTHTLHIDDLATRSRPNGAGIHIQYSEYPGDIIVDGHLYNKRTGFEKYIHFLNATLKYPTGTVRTQFLLLGTQPIEDHFPTGISFRSVAVIRNLDPAPVQVTPTVKFLRNGSPLAIQLGPLALNVNESRTIDFREQQNAGILPADLHQASLEFDPATDHASIVAELFNFSDRTGGYAVGPFFFDYPTRATGSIWRTDGTFQTTLMIENTAALDDQVSLKLFSDGSTYNKIFPIAAGSLLKINVKQLQEDAVPDKEGNLLQGTTGLLSLAGVNGHLSKLSFDKLIHSVDESDYVGLPGGGGGGGGGCFTEGVAVVLSGGPDPFAVMTEYSWSDGTTEDVPASQTVSSNSILLNISSPPTGDMATTTPIDNQTHGVSFNGPAVSVTDCPACSADLETPLGFVNVPPQTPSQHTYPNPPLTSCRVSVPFDGIINKTTGKKHQAQDTVAAGIQVGTPVFAPETGQITRFVQGQPHDPRSTSQCAGQNSPADFVEITTADGAVTRLYHVTILPALAGLQTPIPVTGGQQIGTIDISGCTSAPHTHIQRKVNGVLVNFTMPCNNSQFDDPSTYYDDSDGTF